MEEKVIRINMRKVTIYFSIIILVIGIIIPFFTGNSGWRLAYNLVRTAYIWIGIPLFIVSIFFLFLNISRSVKRSIDEVVQIRKKKVQLLLRLMSISVVLVITGLLVMPFMQNMAPRKYEVYDGCGVAGCF